MEGPEELDDCVQTLQKEDLLDSDLTEYVASLVTAEVNRYMGNRTHCCRRFASRLARNRVEGLPLAVQICTGFVNGSCNSNRSYPGMSCYFIQPLNI